MPSTQHGRSLVHWVAVLQQLLHCRPIHTIRCTDWQMVVERSGLIIWLLPNPVRFNTFMKWLVFPLLCRAAEVVGVVVGTETVVAVAGAVVVACQGHCKREPQGGCATCSPCQNADNAGCARAHASCGSLVRCWSCSIDSTLLVMVPMMH